MADDPESTTINMQLPRELLARLDAECDARVLGRKRLVPILIERGLDSLPEVPLRRQPFSRAEILGDEP